MYKHPATGNIAPMTFSGSCQVQALRSKMMDRRISISDLAEVLGVKKSSLAAEFSTDVRSRRLRVRIEDFMGAAIWSSEADFIERKKLERLCGFNPFLASVPDLRKAISDRKFRGRSSVPRSRQALIRFLKDNLLPKPIQDER